MNITRKQIRQAFINRGTDKFALHGYDQMYYDTFSKLDKIDEILEIGVLKGRSLLAWKDLFPETKLFGLDITLSRIPEANLEELKDATLIEADSRNVEVLKDTPAFDIIIDDGDHHPNMQWETFYRWHTRVKKAYIIEDIIGIENENVLRTRLKKHGFDRNFNIKTYSSTKKDAVYKIRGEDTVITFYAMVLEVKM
jgi:hypothetical protein